MIPIDLSGKVVLVTGGAGELGRVMVRTLGCAGADVVVHYNTSKVRAESLVAEIQSMGVRAMAVQADVTDQDSIAGMKAKVVATLGPPEILVTNAVSQYTWKRVLDQAPEDYEGQFRSSVLQTVLMTQAFVPAMIQKGWGRVIGINTECSIQCRETQSAYVSGKRGMDGVLRVLAGEIGVDGVTVNQIAPGWTITDSHPDSFRTKRYRNEVPLKRRGTAQEVANVVAFIASDLASFISGTYIPVCGGHVMPGI